MHRSFFLTVLVALVALGGCPGDADMPGDANTPGDAHLPGDASILGDTNIPADTNSPGDTKVPDDAGVPGDAGNDCVDSTCTFFELRTDVSDNYDGHIPPLSRHVYHFRSLTQASIPPPYENYLIRFSVVDFGAEVSLNLGLSRAAGRTQPGVGEASACFTGPGTELSLIMATDDFYNDCVMDFDTDYYFTIESLDSGITGGYRFTFGKGGGY